MTRRFSIVLLLSSANVHAYNSPGWKLDADGKVEMKDGHPVFVDAAGNEMIVDGSTISRLNREAQQHRERAERAEAAAKAFEGLDPEAARKAVETVSKLDAKQLIDAGEIDRVRDSIAQQFTVQLNEKDKAYNETVAKLNDLRISGIFSRSEFVQKKLAIPVDFFEAQMRSHFKVNGDAIEVYDRAGNRLMSKRRVGEYADPDEALELLVEQHPQKDMLIRAEQHSGTGSNGAGGNSGGKRTIKRGDFDAMAPHDQAAIAQGVQKGELNIVD